VTPLPLKVDALVEMVGLNDLADQKITTLSGGQRRRLDVAIGIVGRPELLFLDEPTAGFDPHARREFHDIVHRLSDLEGTTILMTTHDLDEADRLADRIAVLDEGRVVAEGTAAELKARVGTETVELFFADLDALGDAAVVLEDAHVDLERLSLRVAGDGSAACVRELLERVDGVERLDLHRPTLDEAFLALTERWHEQGPPQLKRG
jgi:ABC-2 type transport system ATP-binding protein